MSTTVDVDIFIVQRPFIPSSLFSYSFFRIAAVVELFFFFLEEESRREQVELNGEEGDMC